MTICLPPLPQSVSQIARISKPAFMIRRLFQHDTWEPQSAVKHIMTSMAGCSMDGNLYHPLPLAFRAYVRLGVFSRIFLDNALVLLAWLWVLSNPALFTMKSRLQDVAICQNNQDTQALQYNKYGDAIMLEEQSISTSRVYVAEIGYLAITAYVAGGSLGPRCEFSTIYYMGQLSTRHAHAR